MGCWINEYNQGQFSRQSPDLRQFSTTILYDKPVPYAKVNYSTWKVNDDPTAKTGTAYTQYDKVNYLGTQHQNLSNQ